MGEETQVSRGTDTADAASPSPAPYGLGATSRRWFPLAVLVTGIVLTLLAAYYASRTIQLRTRAQFETAAVRTRTSIRTRFEVYDALLHGAAGFIAVEGSVTRDRFKSYIARLGLENNYPGIQGIGFAPRVPAPERENLIASMKQQGAENFRIWPEGERADFYPVTCLEPQNHRNEVAYGYDMYSEPARREAMERACDTGETAASGAVTLVQEIAPPQQPGFLIYLPVYQGGAAPPTVAEKRARLQGFVFVVFRAEDLFASLVEDEGMEAEMEIFDGATTNSANRVFRSPKAGGRAGPFHHTFEEVTALDVCGRTWTTHFSAQPEFERTWIVLSLLGGGVFLSLVMFYLTRAEGRTRRAAERAAERLKISELALRESEERLRRYATELEHRVAERTANLAQSIQSLEGVLYHVAHDLRAPLRSMASFTQILLDEYGDRFDERGRDYTQRISNAAQRMDGLVQDLLAYGRLAHTAVPVSSLSLETEVTAVLGLFSEEIEARRATVDVCSPLPAVKANAAVLNQVLSNLISNALKFVPPETPPQVRICAEETTSRAESPATPANGGPSVDSPLPPLEGKVVRLWVEDNGIGINPEYHERIFRMFERLHGVGSYPGTGIGLAIVRKGVERMGGRVGVKSTPGTGSRFWVELPAA